MGIMSLADMPTMKLVISEHYDDAARRRGPLKSLADLDLAFVDYVTKMGRPKPK